MVRRNGIAIVPEGHPVLSNISVLDNLRAAALMHSRTEAEREVDAALDVFPELRERLQVSGQNLSGGQKQMVVLAQALICRPRYLLIDELSFGLAPAIVQRIGKTIAMIAERGVGILLIEQFTTLALKLATRAYVMERGDITFAGEAESCSSAGNPARRLSGVRQDLRMTPAQFAGPTRRPAPPSSGKNRLKKNDPPNSRRHTNNFRHPLARQPPAQPADG